MAKKTMDGNAAVAHVAYAFTDVAGIYPITPSSTMAEEVDAYAAAGRKNLFDQVVRVVEMQSEAGAAGVVHGALQAGALSSTYTASQGLLLMIPNMYKIAGEQLPGVFHVSARTVAAHALSIFGDHSDVMACRQTGFAMLASTNVQEIMDLSAVAHLASIKGSLPFLHFFDGFRTSSEVQKIDTIDYADLDKLLDKEALAKFRAKSLNPDRPLTRGSAQNPDIFFQAREASNPVYNALPAVVQEYMDKIGEVTGRKYNLFDYYGAPDAEHVLVAMGSVCDTIEEVIDHLVAKGEKVGLIKVRLYRPFVTDAFLAAVPKTAKRVTIMDRTKEPGSIGEPLFEDVCAAYANIAAPELLACRYGLSSKDTVPSHILSLFDNMKAATPKKYCTISIVDDVTHLSLPYGADIDTTAEGTVSCKFWGLGSDGTVGANKNSIKIIGDNTDKYVQAYFAYDSKKSGGITVSHLRFGDKPIKSTYLVSKADFVACHNPSYLDKYDMTSDIKPGGTFLLNCPYSAEEVGKHLTAKQKRDLATKNVSFYIIDAVAIARDVGLGGRINTIMQSAFFKLANIIPIEQAVGYMKDAIKKSYGRRGDAIVNMNNTAVDKGVDALIKVDVPADWANATDSHTGADTDRPAFIRNVVDVINGMKGDTLPVSTFVDIADGSFPAGTSQYEKRGIAVDVPEWIPENCINCNRCAYVCPHAVIRPYLLTDAEFDAAPAGKKFLQPKLKAIADYKFVMGITPLDCTGCGNCAQVCPAKEKALVMKPIETQMDQQDVYDYLQNVPEKDTSEVKADVMASQFKFPYLEYSGACAGCGETPYAKLVTQLYGDRMYIANATGCSSIWGNSAPATPYCKDKCGKGPTWANSLFEDNAEFGFGMYLAVEQQRERLAQYAKQIAEVGCGSCSEAAKNWLDAMYDGDKSKCASAKLVEAMKVCTCDKVKEAREFILNNQEHLVKKSQWIFGGDGWAYDIGYGGLDHVLASGADVNVMVFDTEVYSNTGGQASKATNTGAIAKFAASGKPIKKKDLALMAMSYGYVYVAQIAMGANYDQCIKAIKEAEAYPGPSLIIAYAPCINHGLKLGMGFSHLESKLAEACGYWQLFRFNPALKEQGKNPYTFDSKEPTGDYMEFLKSEVRYSSLARNFPDKAEAMFQQSEKQAKEKYAFYKKLTAQYEVE